jgi:hypothetical protein
MWNSGEPIYRNLWGRLPITFMEHMRGFYNYLRLNPYTLYILLGWSSIRITSLMKRSMYLGFRERMLVVWSWMQCSKLMPCSAITDFSRCTSWIWWWCSLNLVPIKRPVYQCRHDHTQWGYRILRPRLPLTAWRNPEIYFPWQGVNWIDVPGKNPANADEGWANIRQESDIIRLPVGKRKFCGGLRAMWFC